jgi:hypothetical protein
VAYEEYGNVFLANQKVQSILSSTIWDIFGYFGSADGQVSKINLKTMALESRVSLSHDKKPLSSAFKSRENIYFISRSQDSSVIEVNPVNLARGRSLKFKNEKISTFIVTEGEVILAADSGSIYQIDLAQFQISNTMQINTEKTSQFLASFAVKKEGYFFTSQYLYRVDLET